MGVENEDAAVPEVVAFGEVIRGGLCVRLLAKLVDGEGLDLTGTYAIAPLDVAVAGVGAVRCDTEQNQFSRGCYFGGLANGFYETGFILDRVIGRHHDENSVGLFADSSKCCDCNGCRGVARDGLQDNGFRGLSGAIEFFLHQEAMIVIAEDDGWREPSIGCEAAQCGAEQRRAATVEEVNELFWKHRTRQGPEARSGSTREDDGNDREHANTSLTAARPKTLSAHGSPSKALPVRFGPYPTKQ